MTSSFCQSESLNFMDGVFIVLTVLFCFIVWFEGFLQLQSKCP